MTTRTPLLDPTGYFADSAGGRMRMLLVFLLYLFGTLFSFHVLMEVVLRRLDEVSDITQQQIQAGVSILSFRWTFAMLLVLFAASFLVHYVGGRPLSPDVAYKESLTLTSWAFLPGVLLLPVRVAYAYLTVDSSSIETESADPVVAEIEALSTASGDPAVLAIVAVGTLWTVYILGNGIQRTHGSDPTKAYAVAALVGGLLAFAWFDGLGLLLGML